MPKNKVKILSGYRITIPESIRRRMGLKIGQEVEIEAQGGKIIIKVSEKDPVLMLKGLAAGAKKKFGDEIFLEELATKGERSDVR